MATTDSPLELKGPLSITELHTRRGWHQTRLAEELQYDDGRLSLVVRGRAGVSRRLLLRIVDTFDLLPPSERERIFATGSRFERFMLWVVDHHRGQLSEGARSAA